MATISRRQYSDLFGPTTGDRVRLADTNLVIEIEKDYREGGYGDEVVYGGGKTARDGMGADPSGVSREGMLDLVITNAIVIDPIIGIVKADIGVKDGLIAGVGKSGNPGIQDDIHPDLIVGAGTEIISGEHTIVTAGAMDTHVHLIAPQEAQHAISNGITTLWGGGSGPTEATNGCTTTPGPWNIARMLEAAEDLPVNLGLMGKGNSSMPISLREQLESGAAGLKIHEDFGATPAVIDTALAVAEDYDIQVAIHTDSLNEGGYFEDTRSAFNGRTIHAFHSEGAGGGHAPDILRVTGEPYVLPSSTNPTLPYGVNSIDELLDMVMVCHHLSHAIPEDVSFAESRVRAETIAAETVLHDLGVISMISSDSQAMGRIGESVTRAFQIAHHCKAMLGPMEGDSSRNDNQRVLRYLAKVTINPAITNGISHAIGSIEKGKIADLVQWPIESFAAKPQKVLKGGLLNWVQMGDPNASLPTPQPVYMRPSFGAYGRAKQRTRATFMAQAGIANGIPQQLGLESRIVDVRNTRSIGKQHMVRNTALPDIMVDPETFRVTIDGKVVTIEPARELPLTRLFFMV